MAIVGAGPHGLTIAAHLADRWPHLARDLAVFDPSGRWMGRWQTRFAAHQIPTLRSPAVHHPHPDPYALVDFAEHEDRTDELGEYGIPSTPLFDDLCHWVVAEYGLTEVVVPAGVVHLEPCREDAVVLHLTDGSTCRARRVVLAHNPARRLLPAWVEALGGRHADDIDVGGDGLTSTSVAVLGGGLTAAHLAAAAASRGATTRLVCRRALRSQLFDADPGWQGPKELDGFHALADDDLRRTAIHSARGGGSIPPRWREALGVAGVEVIVTGDAEATVRAMAPESLWAATGTQFDATSDPLLAGLHAVHRPRCHGGLPALTDDLRWPGTPVHLMGAYAGLRVGPVARNLAGARHAAPRIAESIAGGLGLAWADARYITKEGSHP